MKGLALVLGGMLVFAGFSSPVMAQGMAQDQQLVTVGNKVCPVTGKVISADNGMAPASYEYKGKLYNLCCAGCWAKFNAEPEKYSKIADMDAASGGLGMGDDTAMDDVVDDMPMGN